MDLFHVEAVNIYAVDRQRREIYTTTKAGRLFREQRMAVNNRTIPGYVAETGFLINIADVHDPAEMKSRCKGLELAVDRDARTNVRLKQVMAHPSFTRARSSASSRDQQTGAGRPVHRRGARSAPGDFRSPRHRTLQSRTLCPPEKDALRLPHPQRIPEGRGARSCLGGSPGTEGDRGKSPDAETRHLEGRTRYVAGGVLPLQLHPVQRSVPHPRGPPEPAQQGIPAPELWVPIEKTDGIIISW